MKKIAFKNFRRFEDFPALELGNISIMVGRNNSGKSTMVKSLLLVLDYLQNQQFNEFSFTNKSLEDANIVTFGRAKNNRSKSNEIFFELELDQFMFSILIYGNDEDTNANISKLIITDNNSNTTFTINYNEETINITKSNQLVVISHDPLSNVMKEFKELGNEIQRPGFIKTSSEGLRILDRFNKLSERVENYQESIEIDHLYPNNKLFNISYPLKLNLKNKTEDSILQEFVSDFVFQNDAEIRKYKNYLDTLANAKKIIENAENKTEIIESSKKIDNINKKIILLNLEDLTLEEKIQELVDVDNYKSEITKSIDSAVKSIKNVHVDYLGANPSKQSALFSIRDKQNNLAQAIHDFKQSKIYPQHDEYIFVKKWMKKFDVGEDFEITFYAGEAYEFYVIDKEGFKAHLADKGMGSLQAMMIILKVATIIRKHKNTLKYFTIIVEEPELNLHPEFQGKLTEFFHDVNKDYQISFIIETHSEYLIRKSQNILVKESYTDAEGLNPNPFKLYYFDVENGPYEMKYQENGKFDRKFGRGFFDYADELEVETYKLNLKKNI